MKKKEKMPMSNGENGNGNIEDLTIKELFQLSPDKPGLAADLEGKDFEEIQKQISSLPQPVPWSRLREEIGSILPDMLNVGLLESWTSAWENYHDLKEDVEESRRSPEETVLSPLAEHSIDSTFHPHIDILLGPKKIGGIEFDVTLTTRLKGLVLGLKNGKLVSLQLAQCEWSGTIAAHNVVLLHLNLKKLDVPGRIVLKHAIPLGTGKDGNQR